MTSVTTAARPMTDCDGKNQLQRWADWRFVTATPAPDLSVVFTDGVLADSLRMVSKRTIDGRVSPVREQADLAVAVDPDDRTLRAAFDALRPGGSCYTEWSYRPSSISGLRRRLRAAGFADVTVYTHRSRSTGGTPEAWLPLGSAAAARWYVTRDSGHWDTRKTMEGALRRISWRVASLVRLSWVPVSVVARKSPASVDTKQQPWRYLCSATSRSGAPEQSWLLLAPGENQLNKIVLLGLDRHARPQCAVKMPRTHHSADAVRREAAVLEQIHALHGGLPGVPRVLLSGDVQGLPFVAESGIQGDPVSHLIRRDETVPMRAAEWQARLVSQGQRLAVDCRARVIEPLLTYLDQQIAAFADRAMVAAAKDALATLPDVPLACEQRDFSPWNVFMTADGEIGVADWESAEPYGFPALDLIYFLTYYTAYRLRARTPEELLAAHRETLASTTPLGQLASRCLTAYTSLTGIDRAALRPLRMLCWLLHSHSEYVRATLYRGEAPSLSELQSSVLIRMWEQEMRAAAPSTAGEAR